MNSELYPWRAKKTLSTVLEEVRPYLEKNYIIVAQGRRYSEARVAEAEVKLGQPFPPEIREFYRSVGPMKLFTKGGPESFGFYLLGSDELNWRSMAEAEPSEDWINAEGLGLGQSIFGDAFWWVRGHRTMPDGFIFLFDHEGNLGLDDRQCIIYSRSFGEFLGKIAHCGDLYPEDKSDELFMRELRELNP